MPQDYNQPPFYHFNEDSIKLVKAALTHGGSPKSVLDLCAGCGVVGIEYCLLKTSVEKVSFLELQTDFIKSIQTNTMMLRDKKIEIINSSVEKFETEQRYDLILCNPPYFFPSSARESKDQRKSFCRMFKEGSPETLIKKVHGVLKETGVFILCFPESSERWHKAVKLSSFSYEVLQKDGKINYLKLFKSNAN